MHLYAQYAAEFVMWNNNVPPFHFINFLACENVPLLSFPGEFYKLSDWGGGGQSKKTQIIVLVLCNNKLYVIDSYII